MSIASVQSLSSLGGEASGSRSLRSGQNLTLATPDASVKVTQAVSQAAPPPKTVAVKAATATYELPSDVVELHQDPDLRGQVVVQYLDQSKNVILQVPSAQELDFERSIAQEFQQAAKLQESQSATDAASEGEKTHGDQL